MIRINLNHYRESEDFKGYNVVVFHKIGTECCDCVQFEVYRDRAAAEQALRKWRGSNDYEVLTFSRAALKYPQYFKFKNKNMKRYYTIRKYAGNAIVSEIEDDEVVYSAEVMNLSAEELGGLEYMTSEDIKNFLNKNSGNCRILGDNATD